MIQICPELRSSQDMTLGMKMMTQLKSYFSIAKIAQDKLTPSPLFIKVMNIAGSQLKF